MELLISTCVWFGWQAAQGATSHELEFRTRLPTQEVFQIQMPGDQFQYCSPRRDEETLVFVTGRDGQGSYGPRSGRLLVKWVWNFDRDGDGIVGWGDFGGFVQDFGSSSQGALARWDSDGDGVVGFGDFSRLMPVFQTCNNKVKVIPCPTP